MVILVWSEIFERAIDAIGKEDFQKWQKGSIRERVNIKGKMETERQSGIKMISAQHSSNNGKTWQKLRYQKILLAW